MTERIHFDGDKESKSETSGLGGCLTVLIYAFMLYFTGRNTQRMITNYKPYIYQMANGKSCQQWDVDETDDINKRRVQLNESSKFYLYVQDYKGRNVQ